MIDFSSWLVQVLLVGLITICAWTPLFIARVSAHKHWARIKQAANNHSESSEAAALKYKLATLMRSVEFRITLKGFVMTALGLAVVLYAIVLYNAAAATRPVDPSFLVGGAIFIAASIVAVIATNKLFNQKIKDYHIVREQLGLKHGWNVVDIEGFDKNQLERVDVTLLK